MVPTPRSRAVAPTRAGMSSMLTCQPSITMGDGARAIRCRSWRTIGRKEAQRASGRAFPKYARPDRSTKNFGEERRHGIADLSMNRPIGSDDFDIVRKRLQTTQLTHRQTSTLPMKRPGTGAWLGLNRP